jgi:hypothetical protein
MGWSYDGRLGNNSLAAPIVEQYIGAGGCTKGDVLKWYTTGDATGQLIKCTAVTDQIAAVAMDTTTTNEKALVCMALPDVVFKAPKVSGKTPLAGSRVQIDITSYGSISDTVITTFGTITQTNGPITSLYGGVHVIGAVDNQGSTDPDYTYFKVVAVQGGFI